MCNYESDSIRALIMNTRKGVTYDSLGRLTVSYAYNTQFEYPKEAHISPNYAYPRKCAVWRSASLAAPNNAPTGSVTAP